jgi:hypothetical protein
MRGVRGSRFGKPENMKLWSLKVGVVKTFFEYIHGANIFIAGQHKIVVF